MKKNKKIVIAISIIVLILIIGAISIILITKERKSKEKVDYIKEIYTTDDVQDILENNENSENNKIDKLMQQIDGEYVVGVIRIDRIDFEGIVYEGTTLDVLAKGVGHFSNSSFLDGNVCLAAHNTNQYWAKLHTLKKGDTIKYTSFLGTKEYKVTSMEQISETDWSKLSDTNENMLTLITCVKGKKSLRLCVQAVEVN